MDLNFTLRLKKWLDVPEAERDTAAGARMLLQLTRNRVQYEFLCRRLDKNASFIARELRKHYEFRTAGVTHAEAIAEQEEALKIAPRVMPMAVEKDAASHRGRRDDHDSLPAEIQQLYVDNLDLLRRMRDAHTRLRILSEDTAQCSDADRMVFVKELRALDKKMLDNWKRYDQYVPET